MEKQGLKPVFGYDVTADDSQTAAQLLEAKNPEFKEWAKEVYKYSDDLIRYRVEEKAVSALHPHLPRGGYEQQESQKRPAERRHRRIERHRAGRRQ